MLVRDRLPSHASLEERISTPIDDLIEMLTFSTQTIYLGMGSGIYRQDESLTMDSLLSPALTNLYMECFEEMALELYYSQEDQAIFLKLFSAVDTSKKEKKTW